MRRAPSGELGNECSYVRDVFRRKCSLAPMGTCGWGWVPVFGMLLAPGSSEFKEEVERGFISKEIVPRRHRAAQRVSPPHSASLPMSPSPKAARMGGVCVCVCSFD